VDDNNFDEKITALLQDRTTMELSNIHPAKYNPHDATEVDEERIMESIDRFGYLDPIVVNTKGGKNIVVGGHLRLKSLQKKGIERAEVVCVELDEVEEKELNMILNYRSKYDMEKLADIISDLHNEGVDVYDLGIDRKSIEKFLEDEDLDYTNDSLSDQVDDDEEGEYMAQSQEGEIYNLGDHLLMCGDSTNPDHVKALIGSANIDLVITSPPYFNQREYSQWDTFNDYMGTMRQVIENMYPYLGDKSAVCWNIGDGAANTEEDTIDIPAHHSLLLNEYLKYTDKIMWDKKGCVFSNARSTHIDKGFYYPAFSHEMILVYTRKHPSFEMRDVDKIKRWISNIWRISPVNKKKEGAGDHSAPFPLEIPRRAILSYSKKKQNVYDPFGGSGTTLIAAEKEGRICLMMEKDPKYCDLIRKRWEEFNAEDEEEV